MVPSDFRFENPRLISIEFNLNKEARPDKTYSIPQNISIKKAKEAKSAFVQMEYSCGDKGECPFFIKAVMEAKFLWEDIDDDKIDAFLDVNAPSLLISYLRPIVSSVTSYAGITPLAIPFMNFSKG